MSRPKQEPLVIPRAKKRLGTLRCENCRITVAFFSYQDPEMDDGPWPQHRCGLDVKPFTKWVEDVVSK